MAGKVSSNQNNERDINSDPIDFQESHTKFMAVSEQEME